ncbi:MAG: NmrA family NAD(P)-binding protein [Terriglobales bacterium]
MAASISDIRLLLKVKVLPKSSDSRRVFITGGTGYIGTALIPILLERGHRVRALVRPGSKPSCPPNAKPSPAMRSTPTVSANSFAPPIPSST